MILMKHSPKSKAIVNCKGIDLYMAYLLMVFTLTIDIIAQNEYSLIRIPSSTIRDVSDLHSLGVDDDHGIKKVGPYYECIVSAHAIQKLKLNAIPFNVVIPDMESFYESRLRVEYPAFLKQLKNESLLAPKNFVTGSMGGYYTYEEIQREMSRLVQFAGEHFVKLDTIGFSSENRPIQSWTFGYSGKEKKSRTLLTSLHHSREPGGVTTLLYFLWDLFEKAKNKDSESLYLLTERTFVVVPCINPDGYAFNQSQRPEGGGLWRKNRRPIDSKTFGVDLNRNYGPEAFWNASNGGSSTDPKSDVYRGESPFSEPETQAIQQLCKEFTFGCILNYHTYSNLLIYPYAALSKETEDSSTFRGFAADATRFNAYSAGRDLETVGYTTRGNSDDWAYHELKALAFTPEVGAITDGFWPSPTRILPHARENLHMNYQALWSSGSNLCIRYADLNIDSLPSDARSIGVLTIDVQNIGRLDLKESSFISVKSLRNDIKMIDTMMQYEVIASGERIRNAFQFEVLKNYRNGDPARFLVTRIQHGVSRIDTVTLALYAPTVYELFVKQEDTSSFQLNGWKSRSSANGISILEDSPGLMYAPNTENYAVYDRDIDLSTYRAAYLQLETQWNIEPMSDFGVIQVSTDKGSSWSYLRTSRMVKGSGLSGGKQPESGFGFQGNMPEWEYQKVDLAPYLKSNMRFRFGMLSDEGAEFNGFAIRNVRVLAFADSFNSVDESEHRISQARIFPLPGDGDISYLTLARNAQGSPIEVSVRVYDDMGKQVLPIMYQTVYEKEMIIPISTGSLPSGIYHLSIHDPFGIVQSLSLPIIR